ncbi:MAG: DUF5668 domain-containing protein [Candidatus Saccharimonadales bacterium]
MQQNKSRITWGAIIVIVGGLLLLNNFNIPFAQTLFRHFWPLALMAAGVLIFIQDRRTFVWAILVSGVGTLLLLRELAILNFEPWQVIGPVAIIVVGLSVLFQSTAGRSHTGKNNTDTISAVLAGSDHKNTSDNYLGTKVTAIMGGAKLDLRKVTIKKDATIDVFAFWGGVEIIVPRDILIKNHAAAILGGVENKTDQDAKEGAPVLHIVGSTIMAGVEIKN